MFKVELWSRIVACKDFIIVHHNSAYLECLVVRSAFVMINDQRNVTLTLRRFM